MLKCLEIQDGCFDELVKEDQVFADLWTALTRSGQ